MLTTLRTTALAAMICMVALLAACSDDSSPTDPTPTGDLAVSLTLNGGGLSNKVLSFADSSSMSTYSAADDLTVVRFNGNVDGKAISVVVSFKGTSKNTRQLDGTSPGEGVIVQWGTEVYAAMTQGSIGITKYDDRVGGEVEGSFSGTAAGTASGQVVTYTISGGSFTSKRAS
ncbi:MAG: hypothetical protein FGM24_04610 [Candidatus Kapabacteria bacterium]|nr:hypothetical protein [Candidatus Kapabacteria bacterium]